MRSSRVQFWLIMVGLLAALLPAVAVQAQDDGILVGQVLNGTADGPEIGAGLSVSLHVFLGDQEVDTLQATTEADGRFVFQNLDTDPTLEYWLEVVYLGVPYLNEEPYLFAEGEAELAATLTVFETTTEDGAIVVSSVHIIAESFGQVLRLSEIHLFSNQGDRTYVGEVGEDGQPLTIFIPLPEQAVGLSIGEEMSSDRYIEAEGGLRGVQPVTPGQETALAFFSYHLPVAGETVSLERRFAYPVDGLNILVAQPGLTLHSAQMVSEGIQSFQDRQYEFYTIENLAVDAPLALDLVPQEGVQGMPASPAGGDEVNAGEVTRGDQPLLRWIGFVLVALVVVAAVAYPLASRGGAAGGTPAPDLAANPRARRLLAELADLEDAFESGEMTEGRYEERRAELYRSLKLL